MLQAKAVCEDANGSEEEQQLTLANNKNRTHEKNNFIYIHIA
jgi:hypothetical protein